MTQTSGPAFDFLVLDIEVHFALATKVHAGDEHVLGEDRVLCTS